MCGIFGYSLNNKTTFSQRYTTNKILAYHNDLRGGDSWGIFNIDSKSIKKGLGNMLPQKYNFSNGFYHTRKATTGKVVKHNSHPFRHGNIIGCHNGIVSNDIELNYHYERNFEVDSQHIFQHINDGLDLCEIQMYGTIVFYDIRSPKVIYLGHSDGDLFIAKTKIGVIFNSTAEGILNVAEKAGLDDLEFYKVQEKVLYKIKNYDLYETENMLDFSPFDYMGLYSYNYGNDFDYKSLTK